jgi:hypothetical protein
MSRTHKDLPIAVRWNDRQSLVLVLVFTNGEEKRIDHTYRSWDAARNAAKAQMQHRDVHHVEYRDA